MITHASHLGDRVTVQISDGRSCTWAMLSVGQASELVGLIRSGMQQQQPPLRLVPRYGVQEQDGRLYPNYRPDLQPPADDDWTRLRASAMAKEAAALADDRGAPEDFVRVYRKTETVLERIIRWLAGA